MAVSGAFTVPMTGTSASSWPSSGFEQPGARAAHHNRERNQVVNVDPALTGLDPGDAGLLDGPADGLEFAGHIVGRHAPLLSHLPKALRETVAHRVCRETLALCHLSLTWHRRH
jgi:hypothetical protein